MSGPWEDYAPSAEPDGPWKAYQQQQPAEPEAPAPVPQANPNARPEPPYQLRGVAALSYSPSRKQWRDETSGKVYNADGSEVRK